MEKFLPHFFMLVVLTFLISCSFVNEDNLEPHDRLTASAKNDIKSLANAFPGNTFYFQLVEDEYSIIYLATKENIKPILKAKWGWNIDFIPKIERIKPILLISKDKTKLYLLNGLEEKSYVIYLNKNFQDINVAVGSESDIDIWNNYNVAQPLNLIENKQGDKIFDNSAQITTDKCKKILGDKNQFVKVEEFEHPTPTTYRSYSSVVGIMYNSSNNLLGENGTLCFGGPFTKMLSWSENGDKLYFVNEEEEHQSYLFIFDNENGEIRKLFKLPEGVYTHLRISLASDNSLLIESHWLLDIKSQKITDLSKHKIYDLGWY